MDNAILIGAGIGFGTTAALGASAVIAPRVANISLRLIAGVGLLALAIFLTGIFWGALADIGEDMPVPFWLRAFLGVFASLYTLLIWILILRVLLCSTLLEPIIGPILDRFEKAAANKDQPG